MSRSRSSPTSRAARRSGCAPTSCGRASAGAKRPSRSSCSTASAGASSSRSTDGERRDILRAGHRLRAGRGSDRAATASARNTPARWRKGPDRRAFDVVTAPIEAERRRVPRGGALDRVDRYARRVPARSARPLSGDRRRSIARAAALRACGAKAGKPIRPTTRARTATPRAPAKAAAEPLLPPQRSVSELSASSNSCSLSRTRCAPSPEGGGWGGGHEQHIGAISAPKMTSLLGYVQVVSHEMSVPDGLPLGGGGARDRGTASATSGSDAVSPVTASAASARAMAAEYSTKCLGQVSTAICSADLAFARSPRSRCHSPT